MALRIEWLPEVKKEDWEVCKAECKYSACGNYRVCKIIPLTKDSRPRWRACFLLKSKNKKGKDNAPTWWPVTKLENGEPKTYRTEDQAFEACDMHADGKHKGNGEKPKAEPVKAEKPKAEPVKAEKPKAEPVKAEKPKGNGTAVLSGAKGARGIAIEACITRTPKSVKELTDESGQKAVSEHMRWLLKKDLVVKIGKGYAINK